MQKLPKGVQDKGDQDTYRQKKQPDQKGVSEGICNVFQPHGPHESMTVENIGRSFPQEFQKRIDQREIRQKLIRPVDHRHRDQPVQGKLEML